LRFSFGKRFREEFFENELERKGNEVVVREREREYMHPLSFFFQISFDTRVFGIRVYLHISEEAAFKQKK
jgi:hypothetical protein